MRPLRALVRLLLSLALLLGGVGAALAFFAGTGAGTASATVGSLSSPTITSATPGAGTVALSWSSVSAPPDATVTYYVTRAGGTIGGNCPSSAATATSARTCTDSGLSKGNYSYTVTAVWQSWTATSASTQVSVSFGALSKFSVSAPSSATAGNALTATITAQDSAGNTITSYSGSQAITFSGPSSAPSGSGPTYPASVSFTGGVGTASITLYDAQSTTLTASQSSVSGTSGSIAVAAGANHQIAASAAASQTAGTPFNVTLTAQDTWGNPTGNLSGTKSLAFSGPSSSPNHNAPAYPPTALFSGGSVTVSVTLYDAQATTITATDTTDSLPGTASGNIVVAPAAASSFTVSTPSPTAGTTFNETLTAYDTYGNPATGYTGSHAITFSGPSNAPSGTNPSYPASLTFANGVGTATITLYDAQTTTLTATQGSITGHSGSFTVAPAAASTFNVPTPSGQTAGAAFNETLTAYDAYSNQATGYTGSQTITFSGPSSSPAGNTPSYPASVSFTNGVGTASITLYDAQTTTLTATQGSVTGTSGSFTVSAATAVKRLGITSTAVSGATSSTANLGPITVQAQDQYGNQQTSATTITVNLSSTGLTGEFATTRFGANVTSVTIAANSSTTSFYYGNTIAGTPSITAAATGLTSASQTETITAGPAGLQVVVAPGGTGTPSIVCSTPYTANETCTATGDGSSGTVVFYVVFVSASGSQVVYSTTQSSTITETGQNSGSVTIAAGASSSSPNTLSASHAGNSTKTSTLTFGSYTLTLNVSS